MMNVPFLYRHSDGGHGGKGIRHRSPSKRVACGLTEGHKQDRGASGLLSARAVKLES